MSLVDNSATSTLPKLLQRNATQDPGGAGIREKSRGVWQTYSWQAYRDDVRDLALGLAALGFQRGDKLSVVGDNRPQLYFAQLSAQALGGVSVPVYQDSIASELVYVLNHAETSIIVARAPRRPAAPDRGEHPPRPPSSPPQSCAGWAPGKAAGAAPSAPRREGA